MWRVLEDFADLHDNRHVYHKGDNYPYAGVANKARLDELSGMNNRFGRPLIEEYVPKKAKKTQN